MKKLYFFILLLIFLVNSNFTFAQDDTSGVIREVFTKDYILDVEPNHRSLVIGAARSTRTADKLPVTVYIISNDEILRKNCYVLTDVLKSVPGIRISSPHSGEFGQAFIQRGMLGNTYTKILLNGVDVNPSGTTGMPLGANLPIRNAERIEIVYGPASASYGNDACGGVINIVTKEATEKNFTNADMGLGFGGYSYFNFATGGKFGGGDKVAEFSLYGSRQNARDLNVYSDKNLFDRWLYLQSKLQQRGNSMMVVKDNQESVLDFQTMEQMLMQNPNFLISMMYGIDYLYGYNINYNSDDILNAQINDIAQHGNQIGFELRFKSFKFTYNNMYRRDHSSLGLSPMLYSYENSNTYQGEFINRWALSADYTIGKVTSNTILSYLRYRMDRNSSSWVTWSKLPQYFYSASDDIALDENINFKPIPSIQIAAGASFKFSGVLPKTNECQRRFDYSSYKIFSNHVDYLDEEFSDFGINPVRYSTSGVYAQIEWEKKFNENQSFTITGGARYDYNSIWGASFVPRIAGLLQVNNNFNVRVSRGYAYKAPAISQIYYNQVVKTPAHKIGDHASNVTYNFEYITSKNLKPENIASTEVGLRYYLGKTQNYMELVYYTNKISNPLFRSWKNLTIEEASNELIPYISEKYFNKDVNPSINGSREVPTMTRHYANVNDAYTRLTGYQFIGVFRNLVKPIELNIDGGLTISHGKEKVQDDFKQVDSQNADTAFFVEVNGIRQTPTVMAQLSLDFTLKNIFCVRVENTYCSSWLPKYYLTTNSIFDKEPGFYNLDLILGVKIGKSIRLNFKCINLTNAEYGGIDVKEMDVDLPYNIQLRRSYRFGISYYF